MKQYSSGMHMRLAFAVATEVDPEILIVDEILAVGMTLPFSRSVSPASAAFVKSGKTILFVSHNMHQIVEAL